VSAWWCGTIERVMRKLLCLLLLACALTMRAQNGIDEKKIAGIVRRFAPPSMVRQSAAHRHEFPLREDDETGRLDRSGKTYVVAAYANGLSAQVGDLQGNHRITKGSVSLNGVLFATARHSLSPCVPMFLMLRNRWHRRPRPRSTDRGRS